MGQSARKAGARANGELAAASGRSAPEQLSEHAPLYAADVIVDGVQYRYLALRWPEAQPLAELTASEHAVVTQASLGLSNAEIAAARRVSRRTIDHQLASAFKKLGVTSRSELCDRIFARGFSRR